MRTVFRAFCLESGATYFSHVLPLVSFLFFVSFLFKIGLPPPLFKDKEEDAPTKYA
jgi:hypothetical protein